MKNDNVNFKIKYLKLARTVIIFVLLLFLLIATSYTIWRIKNSDDSNRQENEAVWNSGNILGEETGLQENNFQSENFKIPQISLGETAAIYPKGEDQKDLMITEVKSELVSGKEKDKKNIVVSWKTSKPAMCALEYVKAGSPSGKKTEEEYFDYSHSVMLTKLDSATTYNFVIKARDKWKNEKNSDRYAFYSGAPDVSFLDLIAGAFKDVFGWAMDRQ